MGEREGGREMEREGDGEGGGREGESPLGLQLNDSARRNKKW